jgi:hypothetical protein
VEQLMAANSFDALAALAPANLLRAQAKLTHIGPQLEPVSTVLFSVYTITPRIDAFQHSGTGVHYGNDRLGAVTTFTVKHAQFRDFLVMVGDVARGHAGDGDWTSVSIMPDIDDGTMHELLLDRTESGELVDRLANALGPGNIVAQLVLGDFRRGP